MNAYIRKYGYLDQSKGQHLTDEFKRPTHITFSDESIYHSPETPGGKWRKDDKGIWYYRPSEFVIKQHGIDKLKDYFKQYEGNSVLELD